VTSHDPTLLLLLYFIMPLWLLAGVCDWLCHRKTHIEENAGLKEAFIHILMFSEMGIPLLAALFLEINALIILLMVVGFLLHEATALWDVSYSSTVRYISPVEQHIHSFLEMVPLMALLLVVTRHWDQALALVGLGAAAADFSLNLKSEPLPVPYIVTLLLAIVLLEIIPFAEELVRCLRKRGATEK